MNRRFLLALGGETHYFETAPLRTAFLEGYLAALKDRGLPRPDWGTSFVQDEDDLDPTPEEGEEGEEVPF